MSPNFIDVLNEKKERRVSLIKASISGQVSFNGSPASIIYHLVDGEAPNLANVHDIIILNDDN